MELDSIQGRSLRIESEYLDDKGNVPFRSTL